MILVSGCLVGMLCRYDGNASESNARLKKMVEDGEAIPVCPEQLGGLSTPRPIQEIQGGEGIDVINGKARVVNAKGEDVTKQFISGAGHVLAIAEDNNISEAVFRSKSPACGCGRIYDGTFRSRLKEGDGVATALLKRHGIKVMTETEFREREMMK